MEEQVLEFSVSALDGREWLTSRPWSFTPVRGPLTCLIHVAYQYKPYVLIIVNKMHHKVVYLLFCKFTLHVNKNPTDATECRYLFTAKLLYMFRVSQHPSSGILKIVPAASGTGHTTCTATPLQRGLIGTATPLQRGLIGTASLSDHVGGE